MPVGSYREPLWPRGIVGSLTHCEGYCAVVAAREERVAGLGVDAELGGELDPDLIPLVCTSAEIHWVRGNHPPPHGTGCANSVRTQATHAVRNTCFIISPSQLVREQLNLFQRSSHPQRRMWRLAAGLRRRALHLLHVLTVPRQISLQPVLLIRRNTQPV